MKKLNHLIEQFIHDFQIDDIEEFTFTSRLSEIISSIEKSIPYSKNRKHIPLKKSMKYSQNFLKSVSKECAKEIENVQLECELNSPIDPYSDYIESTKQKYIYLAYQNRIRDSFIITHELIHATTIEEYVSIARNLFCEMFSFTAEMMQRDFFEQQGIKNAAINDQTVIGSLQEINKINMFQTILVSEFLDRGYITASNFMDLLNQYDEKEIIMISNHISENIDQNNFDIFFQNRYIVGYLFACYFYDYIKDKEEFIALNSIINQYNIEDVIHYLDLEYKDTFYLDLTEESYRKLENSYQKRLKKV